MIYDTASIRCGLQSVSDTDSGDESDDSTTSRRATHPPKVLAAAADLGDPVWDFGLYKTDRIKFYLRDFTPPQLTGFHDESRWTYTTLKDYHPLVIKQFPYHLRLHSRFSRHFATVARLFTHLSRVQFGNREGLRRSSSLQEVISDSRFSELFREYCNFEELKFAICNQRSGESNKWEGYVSQLLHLRRLVTLTLRCADEFIREFGYGEGLRTYVQYHGINVWQTPYRPHPILHTFEVLYFISLPRFLHDYDCPGDSQQVLDILSKTFRESDDLRNLTRGVIQCLSIPDRSLELKMVDPPPGI
ncbi:hypothetical protein GALMADRAFT_139805 [Galerina marginata CBS 339.88]|uniref:Uncharacterized protein n=1 Tax=Galerina marginata (strain CBS 339.88) TaxID=685588 RepID=A0A067SYP3_GALM3|nr:hypothetical protein GALMADRAFT_139805 [Galerina marginata CBS 339.88]